MTYLLCAVVIGAIVYTYPKWSYTEWGNRMQKNAKHKDFVSFSGKRHN